MDDDKLISALEVVANNCRDGAAAPLFCITNPEREALQAAGLVELVSASPYDPSGMRLRSLGVSKLRAEHERKTAALRPQTGAQLEVQGALPGVEPVLSLRVHGGYRSLGGPGSVDPGMVRVDLLLDSVALRAIVAAAADLGLLVGVELPGQVDAKRAAFAAESDRLHAKAEAATTLAKTMRNTKKEVLDAMERVIDEHYEAKAEAAECQASELTKAGNAAWVKASGEPTKKRRR